MAPRQDESSDDDDDDNNEENPEATKLDKVPEKVQDMRDAYGNDDDDYIL